jgi:hypothetical protein
MWNPGPVQAPEYWRLLRNIIEKQLYDAELVENQQ